MSEFENVFVTNHPICCHNLSIIRNSKTTAEVFRNAIRRITYLLFYKATEDLELEDAALFVDEKSTKALLSCLLSFKF